MYQFPYSMASNGILMLYTQFPRCYKGGIDEMTLQLTDIKSMGFNAVWVNPIQATGQTPVIRRIDGKAVKLKGSLYAMYNDKVFNPSFFITADKLKKYTHRAKELKLIPLFDLVLNQVAADDDSPIVKKYQAYLSQKRDKRNKVLFDDTLWFNYHDVEDRETIIREFWEPFIRRYIVDYGFLGVRVDAVKHLNRETQRSIYALINKYCHQAHNCRPVILGELLDFDPLKYVDHLCGLGFTHINNSTFWADFSADARRKGKKQGGWNQYDWVLKQQRELRKIVYPSLQENVPTPVGGTVGYTGNHDEMSLGIAIDKLNKQGCNIAGESTSWKMRELISGVAFSSDAGWYALSGDEYGIKARKPMVFDNFPDKESPFYNYDFRQKWGSVCDLRSFIAGVNYVLAQLSVPTFGLLVRHIVVPESKNLFVIERCNSKTDLICVNLDQNIKLDCNKVVQLLLNSSKFEHKNTYRLYIVDNNRVLIYNVARQTSMCWQYQDRELAENMEERITPQMEM